ncbi:MAG TPA: EAL domain-containing protein [Gammaproteobacteria bacterium]|jgi:diguanylate cyclase (GGDEF)-like protein/PAS domain S-box-containing protein|nr:EAL domain-containing protein [Gammaproteobacteria bacterium]
MDSVTQAITTWQTALQAVSDAVLLTDNTGTITFVNTAAVTLLGQPADQLIGNLLSSLTLVSAQHEHPVADLVDRCLTTQQIQSLEEHAVLINYLGERYSVGEKVTPILLENKVVGTVVIIQNETRYKTLQTEFAYYATHDTLTGLMNRIEWGRHIQMLLATDNAFTTHVLLYLDLDRFKIINDVAGHAAGDQLLRQIGELLRDNIRGNDLLARIGSDEFVILLKNMDVDASMVIINKIIASVKSLKFHWHGKVYNIGISIGIVAVTGQDKAWEEWLSKADVACYVAKQKGGNLHAVYKDNASVAATQYIEMKIIAGIKEAIEKNRFKIYAHEVRALKKSVAFDSYYELLIRLVGEDGQLIYPKQFIPCAERYNLMSLVDEWMIKTILLDLGEKIAKRPDFRFTINLSANSINSASFYGVITDAMNSTPIPHDRIGFELTETAVMHDTIKAGEKLTLIKKYGAFVALDDFGTGLSSFNYIKHFSMKFIKIDGSFIKAISSSEIDQSIVQSINELAHRLGALTVAEYVESKEILNKLITLGVDFAQGDTIGVEVPLEKIIP